MSRIGLEGWLRAHGIRPGPVYTVLQLGAVTIAIAIAIVVVRFAS
jgi:hypothetical protein